VLKPVDGAPVWSISCLFIAKPYRRQGLSAALLEAAAQFARSRGAKLVEGYPVGSLGQGGQMHHLRDAARAHHGGAQGRAHRLVRSRR